MSQPSLEETYRGKTLGIDTLVFIYHIEDRRPFVSFTFLLFEAIEQGTLQAVVSYLTLMEVLVKPKREGNDHLARRYQSLLVGGRFGRIEGAESRLEGLELRESTPSSTRGCATPRPARWAATGSRPRRSWPASTTPNTPMPCPWACCCPFGGALDLWDGRDHLALTGRKLLELAGISFKRYKPGQAWKALDRDLAELRRIGLLGRWQWDPGAEHTEKGICRLYPAEWLLDRAVRGLLPQESPSVNLPQTGAELRAWRKALDWPQQRLAQELGVSENTIYRAEARKKSPLSQALQEALKGAQERLPGLAPEKPKADPGWWK